MNTTISDARARTTGLRQALLDRRHAMQTDVQERIRDSRADRSHDARDIVDLCDGSIEEELSLALLQMRTEALVGIDAALARLDAGKHGVCSECGAEIAESRLRALPFAIRCRRCGEGLEREQGLRRHGHGPSATPLFPEFTGA